MLVHGDQLRVKIWSEKGLANDCWFIILGNIFLPSITSYLNPFYLLRLIKRGSIRKNPQGSNLTQTEANFQFEGHAFDIAQKYGNMMNSFMISIFFMPILPLSLLCGVLAIFFVTTTEKYLLFNRYAAPDATGAKLNFAMYRFFDMILLIFGVISNI